MRREEVYRRYRIMLVKRPSCDRARFRLDREGERFVDAKFTDATGMPVPGFTARWDPPFEVLIDFPRQCPMPVTCEIRTVR